MPRREQKERPFVLPFPQLPVFTTHVSSRGPSGSPLFLPYHLMRLLMGNACGQDKREAQPLPGLIYSRRVGLAQPPDRQTFPNPLSFSFAQGRFFKEIWNRFCSCLKPTQNVLICTFEI